MTVYVDDAIKTRPTKRWPFGHACHMAADDADELHAFAKSIDLLRRWFHRGHYNLTAGKREHALKAGAVPLSRREFAARFGKKHRGPPAR